MSSIEPTGGIRTPHSCPCCGNATSRELIEVRADKPPHDLVLKRRSLDVDGQLHTCPSEVFDLRDRRANTRDKKLVEREATIYAISRSERRRKWKAGARSFRAFNVHEDRQLARCGE